MSASGINWGWKRDMFIRARICPCDPTQGDSCRLCDGTAVDDRERGLLRPTCVRCGHQAGGCPQCGRNDPFLGGTIEGRPYCHTFSEQQPSCYTLNFWAVE